MAGGIGLAPLRGAIEEMVAARRPASLVESSCSVGAREPDQLVFLDDLAAWERAGVAVLSHRRSPRARVEWSRRTRHDAARWRRL